MQLLFAFFFCFCFTVRGEYEEVEIEVEEEESSKGEQEGGPISDTRHQRKSPMKKKRRNTFFTPSRRRP